MDPVLSEKHVTEAWTLRLLQPPQGSWLPGAMGVTRRLATQIDSRCLAWLGAATKEAWDTLRERGQACKDAGEVPAGQAPRKAAAVGEADQGIFPTQGSNLALLHCSRIRYHPSHQGSLLTPN